MKSEFNRCSILRIKLKMGDSEIPVIDKRAALEIEKEESIMSTIRYLRKEVGRKRGNLRGNPKRKRIKLDDDPMEVCVIADSQGSQQDVEEKSETGVSERKRPMSEIVRN